MAISNISNGEQGNSCRDKINGAFSLLNTLIGVVVPFAGSTAPSGWKICDGEEISRATYSELYSVISTTYGGGNGTTTFNIPNLKDKTIFCKGDHFSSLGVIGGQETLSIASNQVPSLNLSYTSIEPGSSSALSEVSYSSQALDPISLIPPYITLNYIIYTGVI